MIPEAVELRADDRPVLHTFRRRRNGQNSRTEFAREILQALERPTPSHVTGPMTINKLMTVTIVADSFGRPPRCVASQLYGGYKATVRTMLHASVGMNG